MMKYYVSVQKNVVTLPVLTGKYTLNTLLGEKKEGVERMHSKVHIYFESHTQTLCVFTLIWMYLGSKKKNFNFSCMISSSGYNAACGKRLLLPL